MEFMVLTVPVYSGCQEPPEAARRNTGRRKERQHENGRNLENNRSKREEMLSNSEIQENEM